MKDRRHPERSLRRAVDVRRGQDARGRHEGEPSLARMLAMIGALGWLMVVPTLAGVFAGRWLDARLGTGITLTALMLLLGVSVGCLLVWRQLRP